MNREQTFNYMASRKLYDGYAYKITKDEDLSKDLKQDSFIRLYVKEIPVEEIYSDGVKALDVFFYSFMRHTFMSKVFKIRYDLNKDLVSHHTGELQKPMRYSYDYVERNDVKDSAEKCVAEFLEFNSNDTKDSVYYKRLYNLFTEIGNISEISRRTEIPRRTLNKDYAILRKMIKEKYEDFIANQ